MGWWNDFADNIATDLGPLISLFGEAPTMQYLSETTMPEDIVIFAMAPIGVLTAVVSAIRVCGSPSLRAFIGRAQEGEGDAEVQLCSSTSRNVGELYNKGGVARIFGRPELLEIVHSSKPSDEDFYDTKDGTAGIHLPKEYFTRLSPCSDWIENGKEPGNQGNGEDEESQGYNKANPENLDEFAPSPNISLNVGIKPRKRFWFTMAAVVGIILQSAVLAWAAVARYYYQFTQSGSTADYAVPMTIIGTILMCSGVGLCAHLVERSTEERVFERKTNCGGKGDPHSQLWWVQPGGQKLGDQVFDPFAYTETGEKKLLKYVTSWKKLEREKNMQEEIFLVYVAVGVTMLGFIMQFLGLRACHSSVSVAQLLVMLIMSMIRAILRVERLKPEDNCLGFEPELYLGHELDWLALHMINDDDARQWHVITSGYRGPQEMSAVGFEPEDSGETFKPRCLKDEKNEKKTRRINWLKERQDDGEDEQPHVAAKAFLYRNRLAHLTSSWDDELIPIRSIASSLARAIEDTANIIFNADLDLNDPEQMAKSTVLHWPIECLIPLKPKNRIRKIHLALRRVVVSKTNSERVVKSKWRADMSELQAILGLWLWSREYMEKKWERISQSHRILWPKSRGLASDSESVDDEQEKYDFDIWMAAPQSSVWTEKSQIPQWSKLNEFPPGNCRAIPKTTKTATFGWHTVPSDFDEADLVMLQTTDSREKACAQEIYSMFLASIIGIVKNIGGTTTAPKAHSHLHLVNTNISRIQEAFTRNSLGSVEEALACLIPVLRAQDKFPPLDGLDADGQTLLHQGIARGGSVSTILALLRIGASVDLQNENGETPLFMLANYRGSDIAQGTTRRVAELLLARGADPGLCNRQGKSPLHQAAIRGNKILAELISRESDKPVIDQQIPRPPNVYNIIQTSNINIADLGGPAIIGNHHGDVYYNYGALGQQIRKRDPTDEDSTRYLGSETPLFLAVYHGNYETAGVLLEMGADPNIARLDGETALAKASESDDVHLIKLLLERHADVNSGTFGSPLHRAAEYGKKDIAELLIKAGADINAGRIDGATKTSETFLETPLFLAVWFEKDDLVRLFLESGADPNISREDKEKPLYTAVWRNNEEVVKLLLKNGADVNSGGGGWETALSFAVREQRTNLVEMLLEHGADPNIPNQDDEAPLQRAAIDGNRELCELLLAKGADINLRRGRWNLGGTPLFYAAYFERTELVKLFLERGADAKTAREDGESALWTAVWRNNEEIVELLIKYGADVNSRGAPGNTALTQAALRPEGSNVRIVEMLLENGADPNLFSSQPPLWIAASWKRVELAAQLLKLGADPNAVGNNDGDTPIFQSVWDKTREPLTKLLLESGADPNHQNVFGRTTLHNIIRCHGASSSWAQGDMTGTVNLLLKWGLDPTLKNKDGESARDMALKKNMTWAINLLEEPERKWRERKEREGASKEPRIWTIDKLVQESIKTLPETLNKLPNQAREGGSI